jgi:signal transduction histidine kinase
VELTVADHGPGVPAGAVPRLFDPFYRVGAELVREKTGVGLGLALAKRFADAVGAELALTGRRRADDTLEAEFTLRLPIARD